MRPQIAAMPRVSSNQESDDLRALGLSALGATCAVALVVVAPAPAESQPSGVSLGFDLEGVGVVKEGGIATPVIGVTATQNVPINIAVTSAPILIAISVSVRVPTNVMAMIAIGEQ